MLTKIFYDKKLDSPFTQKFRNTQIIQGYRILIFEEGNLVNKLERKETTNLEWKF